jgi:DNA-directed RNA polymerase subunit K
MRFLIILEDELMVGKLTRFEKARIIGARALQLAMGAKPLVKVEGPIDPIDVATLELKKKVIPLDIRK